MSHTRKLAALGIATAMVVLAGCSGNGDSDATGAATGGATEGGNASGTTIALRLWDEQAAAAYETALPAFEKETGITVDVEVIPWADYWTSLRNDIAADKAPDVFWTNSSNYADYADAGKLLNIDETFPAAERDGWFESAVEQYTRNDTLWGVPAVTDPGIGVFYNKELLDAAGVTVEELEGLAWDPSADTDTLREITTKLTLDSEGNTPADAGFDPAKTVQFGYNAALDIQAIYLNFLGSNGAQYQNADGLMDFDTPEGVAAFQYIVDLINKYHVAPSAADTNDNGDFSRDQFLQGKLALFQTGSYNLANINDGADFEWGIVQLPEGPKGRISIVNSVVAAGSANSAHPEAQKQLLAWIAGPEGASALGSTGAGLPANTTVQDTWTDFWSEQGIDVTPLVKVLENGSATAPFGSSIQGAMEAQHAVLKEVFLGRTPVEEGVKAAQEAGNAIIEDQ